MRVKKFEPVEALFEVFEAMNLILGSLLSVAADAGEIASGGKLTDLDYIAGSGSVHEEVTT